MGCNKIEYKTEEEAKEALKDWKDKKYYYKRGKRIKRKRIPQRFYKCEICGNFHITRKK